MLVRKHPLLAALTLLVTNLTASAPPVLWNDPVDIASRDLYYGSGGAAHVPQGPFTFVKEDLDGTNPKFVVRDGVGQKWKVKLGLEAGPETAASRIVWAVGYYTSEDYFLPKLEVRGMPARLHRGWKMVEPGGIVRNVRLKREPEEKKAGVWQWREDPFSGTRELNGLRTLMAVLNNWDLKDENNAVYRDGERQIYMISDLGATFGSAGRWWPRDKAKGNLESYQKSKFVRRVTATSVDFQVPARPRFVYLVNPKEYWKRIHLERIGHDVPKDDARWMGKLLARLSQKQICDAFRAAGYSPEEADGFARVIQRRIVTLEDL